MTVAQREEAAELVALARAMKALAHPARLRIVLGLRRAERCGCEFVRELGLDPSVVSRHLAQLRDAGLVAERRDGARVMYRLAWPCVLEAIRCMRQLIGRRASVGRGRSR